jgi:hypothetical protein
MVFCHPLGPWLVNGERDNQDGRDPKAEGRGSKFRTRQPLDRLARPAFLASLARITRYVSRVARVTLAD